MLFAGCIAKTKKVFLPYSLAFKGAFLKSAKVEGKNWPPMACAKLRRNPNTAEMAGARACMLVGSSAYFSRWPYQSAWKQVTSPKETCHPTTHHLIFRSLRHPEAEALPVSKDLARGLSICTVNREVQWASVSLNHSAALLCVCARRLSFPCY